MDSSLFTGLSKSLLAPVCLFNTLVANQHKDIVCTRKFQMFNLKPWFLKQFS